METLNQSKFIPFSMDKNGPNIYHLCYADDTIPFSSCDSHSLGLLMSRLGEYEGVSGQLINRNKSGFYVTFKEDDPRINLIKRITGFNHCQFPMIYLGCLIYVGRKTIVYFNTMVAKVARSLQGWHGKLLSYGGKAVLIKSVLQALLLHLLSAVHPPKTALDQIEMIIANFFWGMDGDRKKKHWCSWNDMSYPASEGGAGFRSLKDICNSFSAKLWWKFRTQNSLLRSFLKANYCKIFYPVAKKWAYGQSHIWKRLMDSNKMIEPIILWKIGNGEASFWRDN
ncbi:uncharacterized protein LOC132611758 [Lycium barbarum]|uniref:uncharacterized protein LOC132611758 n=1 Tax=Lycium barbarum TaxID=112863 RepID=UPI00293F16A1|nr:uncharacterized protein LOC132611758 [Lycium barbarum]